MKSFAVDAPPSLPGGPIDIEVSEEMEFLVQSYPCLRGDTTVTGLPSFCLRVTTSSVFLWTQMTGYRLWRRENLTQLDTSRALYYIVQLV